MKEALYYEKLEGKKVKCNLCPHNCIIPEEKTGICRTRKNINGVLYSIVYGKPVSISVDPVEKKPLFHFYPNSRVLSFGTFGCNLSCAFCQNYSISKIDFSGQLEKMEEVSAQKIIDLCRKKKCKSIAYTYNEPTVFYEYVLDVAKLAKTEGMRNILVSNGFINEAPLKEIARYIDAANIDLKSFKPSFYKKVCVANLAPVLRTLKILKDAGVWIEITFLAIPGFNDSADEMKQISSWIRDNLGRETPLHILKFFPHYKMRNVAETSDKKLVELKKLAESELDFVYIGNTSIESGSNTYCPSCKKLLVGRSVFGILAKKIYRGKCPCGKKIAGFFTDSKRKY